MPPKREFVGVSPVSEVQRVDMAAVCCADVGEESCVLSLPCSIEYHEVTPIQNPRDYLHDELVIFSGRLEGLVVDIHFQL